MIETHEKPDAAGSLANDLTRRIRRNRRILLGGCLIVLLLFVARFAFKYRAAVRGVEDYYRIYARDETEDPRFAAGELDRVEIRPYGKRLPLTLSRRFGISLKSEAGALVMQDNAGTQLEFWLDGNPLAVDSYSLEPAGFTSDFELIVYNDWMDITQKYPLLMRLRLWVFLREALGFKRDRLLTQQVLSAINAPVLEDEIPSGPEYPVNVRGINIGLFLSRTGVSTGENLAVGAALTGEKLEETRVSALGAK